nr:hypothetical protein CFP56_58210 [Quercus suber]
MHTHAFFPIAPERMLEFIRLISEKRDPSFAGENITMMPTDLLLRPGTIPIFTIRDPRLAVPSSYRTMQKMGIPRGGERANYLITTSNIWNRVIYDFYAHHGVQPLVLDADDYMTSEDFVRRVCEKAGLDPAQAHFSWPAATEAEMKQTHPMHYASQSTLINSVGMNPAFAAKNVDMVAEEAKWEAEFGDDVSLVKQVMDLERAHYEYLRERRFTMEA